MRNPIDRWCGAVRAASSEPWIPVLEQLLTVRSRRTSDAGDDPVVL